MNIFIMLILVLGVTGYVTYPLWGQTANARKRRPLAISPLRYGADLDELELDRTTGRLAAEDFGGMGAVELPAAATRDEEDEIERRVRAFRDKRGAKRTATTREKRNRG